ncbi:NAD(P)H-dependent oxidoreductase [Candidatus Gottesmanbacteria bacterium]|nr:NAD(P)H-dependent oxidoreductase [Candidatus Gottesmanbacteria bacterium]
MKIAVILGSTRKVRRGARVAKWLMRELAKFEGIKFELLDLLDYPLPFYDEPNSPDSLENGYSIEVATKWAAKIGEADGYILIVSEYNHGPTAVLKNALDYVYNEWNKKPVTFVSYATGTAGGTRAVEQLRQITVELQMAPMNRAVHVRNVLDTIDTDGKLLQGNYVEQLEKAMKQLLWWTEALKSAREKS